MRRIAACFVLLLPLSGCGDGGPEIIPTTGTVTLDSKPVSGAGVLFVPADGPMASDTTDADGKFTLMTGDRPGAVAGENKVAITLQKTSGVTVEEGGLEGEVSPGGIKTEWIVPQKYSKPDSSGLTADVSSEKHEFNFDLKSK